MTCSACGRALPERAKFCAECGAAVARRCASCGVDLAPGAKFYSECGSSADATPPREVKEKVRPLVKYTPGHLVEKILQSRSALEGERKQVTVSEAPRRRRENAEEWLATQAEARIGA